mgnify:CR=1 FL=1
MVRALARTARAATRVLEKRKCRLAQEKSGSALGRQGAAASISNTRLAPAHVRRLHADAVFDLCHLSVIHAGATVDVGVAQVATDAADD